MDLYVTSKNTGPSYGQDPKHVVYIGQSLDEAREAIGDFRRYIEPADLRTKRFPELWSAIPKSMVREMIDFYMADGWWYSIVKIEV